MSAETPPQEPQETQEGSSPRPTLKELERRAEALAKAIRKHLERGTRR